MGASIYQVCNVCTESERVSDQKKMWKGCCVNVLLLAAGPTCGHREETQNPKNLLTSCKGSPLIANQAGKGAYSNAISIYPGADANDTSDDVIAASSFLAFHSVLKDSHDYTEALRWSRILAQVGIALWSDGSLISKMIAYFIPSRT